MLPAQHIAGNKDKRGNKGSGRGLYYPEPVIFLLPVHLSYSNYRKHP